MDEKLFEFKRQLKKLAEYRGSGTELISVYIPAGSPLHDTAGKLRQELSQASNIKSKSTRTNVMGALEKILQHFKVYRQTPKDGIAIFAGNISDNPAKIDIELFVLEPPQPLGIGAYRCDNKFFLEPLERMVESQNAYGIVVLDGRDATLAIMKGTHLQVLKHLHSTAHQKVSKGGQCLAPKTLIQKEDGEICDIEKLQIGNKILSMDLKGHGIRSSYCEDVFKTKSKAYHIVKTHAPATEIKATPFHRFLVIGEYGIREKYAKDLITGDRLLAVRRVKHKGKRIPVPLDSIQYTGWTKECRIPGYFDEELAYFMGVVCGDGTLDGNRIIIYEGKKELVGKYTEAFGKLFQIEPVTKKVNKTNQRGSFAKKASYEIRMYSLRLVNFVKSNCAEVIEKTENRDIPRVILKSNNTVAAAFLKGFFDAEGYVNGRIVSVAGRAKKLIQKCQLLLLRFGILSSFKEKKVQGKPQWHITITDLDSLRNFKKQIGFKRSDKAKYLAKICNEKMKSQQYTDQMPIHGRQVYRLIKSLGLSSRDFRCSGFFTDKKAMGRKAFERNILLRLRKKISKKGVKQVYDALYKIYKGDTTIAQVAKNIRVEEKGEFYDLTVPETENFLANGLLVHNSQRRFQRLVEEQIEYYYKRVGHAMDDCFLPHDVKEVIIGGPGPTKQNLVKMKPFNYQFKILGVVDTGYTDEYGLREVLAKSEELLVQQESIQEKMLVDQFIKAVVNDGLAVYGEKQVREAVQNGQADKVLLSEELPYKRVAYTCSCGNKEEKTVKDYVPARCGKCGNEMKAGEEKNLLDDLIELAQQHKLEIVLISTNTTEGAQFLQGFTGIGAFLRYKA